MGQATEADEWAGEEPLEPAYTFNDAGCSIVLYQGPIGGLTAGTRAGGIELSCGGRLDLRWWIEAEHEDIGPYTPETTLQLNRRGRNWTVDVHRRDIHGGWINRAEYANAETRLSRVIVQWMNLPAIGGSTILQTPTRNPRRWWTGRWRTEIDGWSITLDQRPDHRAAFEAADHTDVYVLTHVMEIRRSDGGAFDKQAAEHLLESMRVGMSFAFGRWIAPVFPVGYDASGQVAWECWTLPICDSAARIGHAWMCRGELDDLAELLSRTAVAFRDPSRTGMTRFQMVLAVQAVQSGFVEQRIMAAMPALEHLSWTVLVLGGQMTAKEYRLRGAADRLRLLLTRARIPTEINTVALPELADFARGSGDKKSDDDVDGPAALTRVRNRLIHPKSPHDQIYHVDGLVQNAWQLSLHYLTLLVLHSIGYQGSYVKLIPPTGWASDSVPVPWVSSGTPE